MKKIYYLICLFVVCGSVAAQSTGADSTRYFERKSASYFNTIAYQYLHNDMAAAKKSLEQALQAANAEDNAEEIAKAFQNYGKYYALQRVDSIAHQYFTQAASYYLEIGDTLSHALSLFSVETSFRRMQNNSAASNVRISALSVLEELNTREAKIHLYKSIGDHYYLEHRLEKASSFYEKASKLLKVSDELLNYQILVRKARILMKKKNFTEARNLLMRANSIASLLNSKRFKAITFEMLGNSALRLGQVNLADEELHKALRLKNTMEINTGSTLNSIAKLYELKLDKPRAIDYYLIAFRESEGTRFLLDHENSAHALFRLHKESKPEEALKYLEIFSKVQKLRLETEFKQEILEMNSQFETEAKSKEIELLVKESEINEVQIKKQREQSRFWSVYLGTTIGVILLLTFFLVRINKMNGLLRGQRNILNRNAEDLEYSNQSLEANVEELQKIKSELSKEKAFLHGLIDAIPDLIFYKDSKSAYIGCNKAYGTYYDMNPASIVGKTDRDLFPPEFATYFKEVDEKIIRSGKTWRKENVEETEGIYRVLDTYKTPIYSENGQALGVMGISRDVTDIMQARDEIVKLSQAVEQNPVAIIITDPKGEVEYVNTRYTVLSGKKPKDVIGRKLQIFTDSHPNWETGRDIMRTLKTGSSWKGEFENERDEGDKYWEISTYSPIYDKSGNINHILVIKEEITERKSKEDELLRARKEALEASKAKSSFLANMSHEIRTPMNGIMGMADILLTTELNDEQTKYVNIINSSASNLLSIINDILDFSKIEAGRLELENLRFSPKRVVEEVMEILKIKFRHKKVLMLKSLAKDLPENLIGDPLRLRQVLINLTDNAMKFTEKGFVELTCKLKRQTPTFTEIYFKIKDTGIGISEENQAKLFKSFSQVDDSTTRKYGGTGLGLLISKLIVNLMNGKIEFYSEEGKGSEFYFSASFRTAQEEESVNEIQNNELEKKTSAEQKQLEILLVEDNVINQKVAQISLAKLNHKVETAENGLEAVEFFKKKKFDVILMDIQMPEMDGYEASRVIRDLEQETGKGERTKIVAVTANAIKGDREKCFAAGMDDYISKPFKFDELKKALELGS